MSIRVTVWNENLHDRTEDAVKKLYPEGLHGAIRDLLKEEKDMEITTVTLDMPDCGLSDELLDNTDVLIWWGHVRHQDVPWEWAEKIAQHVQRGMGFIALHSAHLSRPFIRLMGTSCTLRWRDDTREHLWCTDPTHPIAKGLPASFAVLRLPSRRFLHAAPGITFSLLPAARPRRGSSARPAFQQAPPNEPRCAESAPHRGS